MTAKARVLAATALFAAISLVSTGGAGASESASAKIIYRCTHGESIGGFPEQAYAKALRELPTEVIEYGECAELIRDA